MDELNPRQREILTCIIKSYISSPVPVSSRSVADHSGLELSSASLRHEMGILEDLGFLTHPYTSAGRVPTDKGYRFYVTESVVREPISASLLHFITEEMGKRIESLEGLMERASHVLSAMAEEAVLVTFPQLKELYLKELSLIALDETRVLAVWCSTSGLVQNCIVDMEVHALSSEELERVRRFINEEFAGEPISGLEALLVERVESRRDSLRKIYEKTLQIIQRSIPYWEIPRLFVEGSRYILKQPEFQDVRKLQLLMAALEEKSSLIGFLHRPLKHEGIRVAIGAQELSKEIWDCALVSAPYLRRGKTVGTLGILGPRRMPYGRMMELAHQMAQKIGHVLDRWGSS